MINFIWATKEGKKYEYKPQSSFSLSFDRKVCRVSFASLVSLHQLALSKHRSLCHAVWGKHLRVPLCERIQRETHTHRRTQNKNTLICYVKKKCIPYWLQWALLVTSGRGKFPLARLSQSQRARQKLWNIQFWLLFFQLQALQTTIDFGLRRCWRIIFLFQITFRIPIRLMYLPLGSQWLIIVIN